MAPLTTQALESVALPVRGPRDKSVDVLKGLGIVIVVMGHIDSSGIGGSIIGYLYTFNVALFFTVAGYMWREKVGVSLYSATWLKFRQLYLPYVLLFTISILFGHLFVRYVLHVRVIPFEWKATIKALLFSSEALNSVPTFNFPLWFLPIFFISSVVFQLMQQIRNLYAYAVVLVSIMLVSIPMQNLVPGRPVLAINVLPVALGFMGSGYLIKKGLTVEKLNLWTLIPLFGFSLWAAYNYPGNVARIGSYWYFPSALASFLLYLRLAQDLRSSTLLAYIGQNSLIIFGIHSLVGMTYSFVKIQQYFSEWNGLMLYLLNLAYVILVSVLIVIVWRWIMARLAIPPLHANPLAPWSKMQR